MHLLRANAPPRLLQEKHNDAQELHDAQPYESRLHLAHPAYQPANSALLVLFIMIMKQNEEASKPELTPIEDSGNRGKQCVHHQACITTPMSIPCDFNPGRVSQKKPSVAFYITIRKKRAYRTTIEAQHPPRAPVANICRL